MESILKIEDIKRMLVKALGGFTDKEYNSVNRYCKELYDAWIKYKNEVCELEESIESTKPFNKTMAITLVTHEDIKPFIKQKTGKYEILDGFYTIPTLTQLKQFLAFDKISANKWTNENYDCDNFALDLWSRAKEWDTRLALGFVTITLKTYRHAINYAFVMDDGDVKLVFIEPQNDRIYFDKFPGMIKVDNMLI